MQVYVPPQAASVTRPAFELKGFDKKLIGKGASQKFRIKLPVGAFSYYDISSHCIKKFLDSGRVHYFTDVVNNKLTLSALV